LPLTSRAALGQFPFKAQTLPKKNKEERYKNPKKNNGENGTALASICFASKCPCHRKTYREV